MAMTAAQRDEFDKRYKMRAKLIERIVHKFIMDDLSTKATIEFKRKMVRINTWCIAATKG